MKVNRDALLGALPPPWPEDLLPEIRARVAQDARKIVVLDDDPTGTQTVQDVTVLTRWTPESTRMIFEAPEPLVYLLTNTRSLPAGAAQELNNTIYSRLVEAAAQTGRDFAIISRGDSTLRGHFPAEVEALQAAAGKSFDGVMLAPSFFEGGRYTIGDVHYVAEAGWLVPAGETEYARDAVFGYRSSNLRAWVSEKTGGRTPPEAVASISIHELRRGGPLAVCQRLLALQKGQVCVANAAAYCDLEVLVLGLLQAEAEGRRLVCRSAASFVRVRAGLAPREPLAGAELAGWAGEGSGLVIAGSYIQRSSQQIEALQDLNGMACLEVAVEALLAPDRRAAEIKRAAAAADAALAGGLDSLVFTSRGLVGGGLETGGAISSGLVEIVRRLRTRPGWMIAKGGITASDIATHGLGVRAARVIGQALPGVPAWRTGAESRWPGLLYIVFPGNVGGSEAIAELVQRLRKEDFNE